MGNTEFKIDILSLDKMFDGKIIPEESTFG